MSCRLRRGRRSRCCGSWRCPAPCLPPLGLAERIDARKQEEGRCGTECYHTTTQRTRVRLARCAEPWSAGSTRAGERIRPRRRGTNRMNISQSGRCRPRRRGDGLSDNMIAISESDLGRARMRTVTATEAARNFSRVLDLLEHESEEIVVLRNNQPVAKLVPGAPRMTALEALADLYRTLPDAEGAAWIEDARRMDRRLRKQVRDPWA